MKTEENYIKQIDQLLEEIDKAPNKKLTLYAPYHDIFWYNSAYHYITYTGGYITSKIKEEEILRSNPFKILILHFSYKTKTKNKIILNIESEDKNVDLITVLFGTFLSEKGFYSLSADFANRREKIKNSFKINETENGAHEITIELPDFIHSVLSKKKNNSRPSILDIRTDIQSSIHTKVPLFLDKNDLIPFMLYSYKEIAAYTLMFVRTRVSKTLLSTSWNPKKEINLLYGRFHAGKSVSDIAMFRKVLMRTNRILSEEKENFRKHLKSIEKGIKKNTIQFQDIDLENLIDYRRWNEALQDFMMFSKTYGERKEYFKNYIKKYEGKNYGRKGSQTSYSIS